jgi:hypothetical protein
MRQQIVVLPRALKCSRLSKSAWMTLSTGVAGVPT